jgi:hypothetical protein
MEATAFCKACEKLLGLSPGECSEGLVVGFPVGAEILGKSCFAQDGCDGTEALRALYRMGLNLSSWSVHKTRYTSILGLFVPSLVTPLELLGETES